MKHFFSIIFLAEALLIMNCSCLSSKKTQSDLPEEKIMPAQTIVPDTFVLPHIPETIKDPTERWIYLSMHYWDRFDFNDRSLIWRPEITEQAFVDYINVLDFLPKEKSDGSLSYTLHKAENDTLMYIHFLELFEKYFYDPNSPFRNNEYYLSVLEKVMESSLLSEEGRAHYGFQWEMSLKNRVGGEANDFFYTLSSGESFLLYNLKSEYTLLMFTDPGCSTCADVTQHLDKSIELNNALRMNSPSRTMLTILALYLDKDLDAWSRHMSDMPSKWLYAYDKSGEITAKKLYDIRAYPTLYLLDKDKKVILKDASLESIESFFSVNR